MTTTIEPIVPTAHDLALLDRAHLLLGRRVAELVLPLYDDGELPEDVDAVRGALDAAWASEHDEATLEPLRRQVREVLGEAA